MSDPAVFLDRDGVLNEIIERDGKPASPRTPAELRITEGAAQALERLRASGFRLFVVTNQPDVARGLMASDALDAIHAEVARVLPVEEIAACRHDNVDNCDCRKPKPGLVTSLAARHDIDLARSWMVGDQDRDILCGRAAGVRTVLLERAYNGGADAAADLLADTLSQAVDGILAATLNTSVGV